MSAVPPDPTQPISILAVDDNPDDRFVLRRLLERSAVATDLRLAGTAHEAQLMFGERPAACVLLDYGLPDMTGTQLADALRTLPGGDKAAFVMLTGQGSEAIAVDAMKRGIHDYLVKGAITAESLEFAMSSALERARTRIELQQKQADLEASNRELTRFSSMVAHDLQSPITSMEMMLRVLQARAGHEPELQAYADNALAASRGMRDLIVELLDYSRVGGGKGLGPVDLAELEQNVRTALAGEISASGAELRWLARARVHADRTQLSQLLSNLVSNSIKYSAPGRPPVVVVDACATDQGCRLSVTDNGRGMDPEFCQRAFEPFCRGDHDVPGTGLGLAICRKIAEVHGTSIEVASTPGTGSTFSMTLPHTDGPLPSGTPKSPASTRLTP